MCCLSESDTFYLYPYPTNMRKSFYTLSGIVKNEMRRDVHLRELVADELEDPSCRLWWPGDLVQMAVAFSLDVFLGALRAAAKGSCRILQKSAFQRLI